MCDTALKESGDRLAEAQRLAHVGSWSVDLSTEKRTWSDELYRLLGYEPGEVEPGLDRVFERFHPEDRERLEAGFLAQMADPGGWHEEFRIVLPGGGIRWLAARTEPVIGPTGDVVGVHGTAQDVTERRRAEEQLRFQAALLTAVAEAIIATDLAGKILYWGPGAERLYGWSAPEVEGRAIAEVIPVVPRAHDRDEVKIRLTLGEPWDGTMERGRKDGSAFVAHVSTTPIHDDTGRLVGNISVCTDVGAREEANASLERARDEALAASLLKSQFLSNMSHEIRTPMNGVIGLTGLLLDSDLTEAQRRQAQGVRASGEALLGIINDILDFSKIEAGKLEVEAVDFDACYAMEEVAGLVAGSARSKGLELVVDCRMEATALRGDVGRLRQILLNLAGNAVKFTDAGEVVIRADVVGEAGDDPVMVQFEVTDTGIGMDAATAARVFDPFVQADASTTRRYGGTGLGLAICRRLADAMGGTIGVDSTPGQGSVFRVRLPFGHALEPVGLPGVTDDQLLRDKKVLVVDDNQTNRVVLAAQLLAWNVGADLAADAKAGLACLRHAAAASPYDVAIIDLAMPGMDGLAMARVVGDDPELAGTPLVLLSSIEVDDKAATEVGFVATLMKPARTSDLCDALVRAINPGHVEETNGRRLPAPPAIAPGSRGTLLIVEDQAINQEVARGIAAKLGFSSDVAADGEEALAALERRRYDAVLMDCHMPRMDGYQATAEIRRRKMGGGHIPIIAMTAGAMAQDKEKCLAAGMDAYVAKPVTGSQLEVALGRWIAPAVAVPAAMELLDRSAAGTRAVAVAVEEPAVLDLELLATLQDLAVATGDPTFLQSLIELYLTEIPPLLTELKESVRRGDMTSVGEAVHGLKGSSGAIGATLVALECEAVEAAARSGRVAVDGLDRLSAELARAATAMRAQPL